MSEFSVLIGGQAGYGIDKAGVVLARLFGRLGYRVYIYRDYPSLIRGGHTFSIIRASKVRINAHRNNVDFLLALNQDTVDLHKNKLNKNGVVIFDSAAVKTDGLGLPIGGIVKEEGAAEITRNTCLLGAFAKAAGIGWAALEQVLRQNMPKELEINLKVARRGFEAAAEKKKIEKFDQPPLPILTGNEALSLGLIAAGLQAYVAYPMTPASTILHFMAEQAEEFSLKVLQPESEIGVMLTALGFSYAGTKAAVGTSGGGFCLMTEGVSFAGMAELPIVIIVGQRTGPSTGLPTYTGQTELHFVLNAGQGEFTRFIVAPGDPEEAYYWGAVALNLAWQFQIPAFILTDKTMAEGGFNFDLSSIKVVKEAALPKRAFPGDKEVVVKINSYEHDAKGLTTEDAANTKQMAEKRLLKGKQLAQELEKYETVKIYGDAKAATAILCWGSNKGVCVEAAQKLGLKVIQPLVLSPFPVKQFESAVKDVKKLICVENNATGQLAKLLKLNGFSVDEMALKYDGRPFDLDELEGELKKWI
ncbi:pyruvate ferredoxin oxidoreductase [candidate division WOR-1 bacterium RIFCSPHIGHO2_01_FULL_53_15]|uniref:Pyruvate ferredoxin oxidoreductase n=1 Tax=candidate division WOR-1 bacterium RIFCSPHIGHO2_01_FULL_53_15 TaxID=1802564 RepID=A0A1F4Q492_UNCSA|nr:MAG: pyruvate ferredoxin oxidoreductase [candidate division WOR-1 bacterium RIFCSPHIGHO2_01_FULL_53_15]OGC13183.1 MAG: pyruvate ferredoxin oxidoreductase [candidate division WOR-1 bacterium RIFCSPHIGHO2_02_FULL_53_26]